MAIIAHAVIGTPAIHARFPGFRLASPARGFPRRPDCEPMTSASEGETVAQEVDLPDAAGLSLSLRLWFSLEDRLAALAEGDWKREVLVEARCPPRRVGSPGLDPVPGRTHPGRLALPRPVRRRRRRPDPGADPRPGGGAGRRHARDVAGLRRLPTRPTSIKWGLSGFSDPTVWLIFGALVFSTGYEKTGLGRRIALSLVGSMGGSTLGPGLRGDAGRPAPSPRSRRRTPGRSAGVIFPIVRGIPAPLRLAPGTDRPAGRRLPDVDGLRVHRRHQLALPDRPGAEPAGGRDSSAEATGIDVSWSRWLLGFLPVGVLLIVPLPLLVFLIYPPEVRIEPGGPRLGGGGAPRDGPADVQGRRDGGCWSWRRSCLWVFGGDLDQPDDRGPRRRLADGAGAGHRLGRHRRATAGPGTRCSTSPRS